LRHSRDVARTLALSTLVSRLAPAARQLEGQRTIRSISPSE
jgi:hypothetical protein